MIVTYTRGDPNFSAPGFLRRYDARRGTPLGKPLRVGIQRDVAPKMTPDGRLHARFVELVRSSIEEH